MRYNVLGKYLQSLGSGVLDVASMVDLLVKKGLSLQPEQTFHLGLSEFKEIRTYFSSRGGGEASLNCHAVPDIAESSPESRSSNAISFSSCTNPGGSTLNLVARRATSSRHRMTCRGWLCSTVVPGKYVTRALFIFDLTFVVRRASSSKHVT